MTPKDVANSAKMGERDADWRNGAIVYQVFVDRFAPSAHLDQKRDLYKSPRSLHPWSEVPKSGHEDRSVGLWSHELAFWGGDLPSLTSKLDYIQGLGADVLYLNPIHSALTNHKYDSNDWKQVSPEYGTRQDVKNLAHDLHSRGMKLMLDGVFNHLGRSSPFLQAALKDPASPYRKWFFFGSQYPSGYRAWANVRNLAEVKLETPEVQKYIWASPDSVVQGYLHDGVDGWRLDTAYELGPNFLQQLTESAHHAKSGSAVVGEVWNYPSGWAPPMDGVMNYFARQVVLDLLSGKMTPQIAAKSLERMVQDCDYGGLLKSWLLLDSHDTDRLKSSLPEVKERRLAQTLQFTLPGSPVLYYGVELGMEGAGDPGSRGPMRWDLVSSKNLELTWTKRLVQIRKTHRALRIGDYVPLDSDRLLAFARTTDKALETVFVFANPTSETVKESVSTREGRLMNGGQLKDLIDGSTISTFSGIADVSVPPKSARVYVMVKPTGGYTPYKRIH